MRPEDRLILVCLRQDFTSEHMTAVFELANSGDLDWERIALTAEQHGIPALIHRNLSRCRAEGLVIPENAFHKLKLSVYRNALDKERQTERLIRALSFLQERGLQVMLIKGAALDCCVYQNADYVVSNDIDIIIRDRREDLPPEKSREVDAFLYQQGIECDFFAHHDLDITGLLPIDFESIWEHAEPAVCLGFPVLLMSATDMLLSLCINSSRKRYFRLKSICDVHETLQARQDISWQQVAERARSFECENIAYTALLVTSLTIGSSLPAGWEEYFPIHPLRKKLIKAATQRFIKYISFYPYPLSGFSVLGRPMHASLFLPYAGYTRNQVAKKLSYAFRVRGNQ